MKRAHKEKIETLCGDLDDLANVLTEITDDYDGDLDEDEETELETLSEVHDSIRAAIGQLEDLL